MGRPRPFEPGEVVLGIETSTPWGGVALASAREGLIALRHARAATGYSRRLLPAIDSMLREAELDKEAIRAVAVTAGPGSFTGVRLGVTTAKTLAHALGVPLYVFSTLERLAGRLPTWACGAGEGAGTSVETVCALMDARRGEVFAGLYSTPSARDALPESGQGGPSGRSGVNGRDGLNGRDGNGGAAPADSSVPSSPSTVSTVSTPSTLHARLTPLLPDAVLPLEKFLASKELLDAVGYRQYDYQVFFTGDAIASEATRRAILEVFRGDMDGIRSEGEELRGVHARFVPTPFDRPCADSVALAGVAALAAGEKGIDPLAAAPFYVRDSDAERKFAPGGAASTGGGAESAR